MAPARDRRTGFSRRRQYGLFAGYVLAIAGAVVGAVLLVLSIFNPPAFAALRMGVAGVTTPVSSAGAWVIDGIASIPKAIGEHFFVKQENAALRKQVAAEHALLMRARTIAYDNRRLRALLKLRDRDVETVVTARLVSSTASSARRFALLNAGRWQGVLPGMPVRGPDGLVGRVLETGPNAARILLLSDPESIVPVRRTRDGLPAIVVGRGDGMVDVRSVNATNVQFARGDLFVSSGTGGLYGPGVPVAKIAQPGRDSVIARTFAQPDSLDFAIVERAFLPIPPRAAARQMSSPDYNPFADDALPQTPARALPWVTTMTASLLTIVPLIATVPLLPPFGLLVLLAWRLLARFSLRMWAAAPLGAFDDLVSGQPLGSAVLLWSLCFLAIDLVEQRMIYRDFWQDWLIAGGGIAFCLSAGRLIAAPIGAHVDSVLVLQIVMSAMLFPLAARFVAWLDRKRGPA